MHVILIETAVDGHHKVYLQGIIVGLVRNAIDVTLYLPCELQGAIDANSFLGEQSPKTSGKLSIRFRELSSARSSWPRVLKLIANQLYARRFLLQILADAEQPTSQALIIPFGDVLLFAIGVLGLPLKKTAPKLLVITMRQQFHLEELGVICPPMRFRRMKQFLYKRFLDNINISKVFTIDPTLAHFAERQVSSCWQKLEYLPDPIRSVRHIDRAVACEAVGIQSTAMNVLIYGVIDDRKGIDLLVGALSASSVRTSFHLLIVGAGSIAYMDRLKNLFDLRLLSISIIDHYIDDEFEDIIFGAADVVWLGYVRHYTISGVLWKACAYRKAVIATTHGLIGYLGSTLPNVMTVDVNNRMELVRVLTNFANRRADLAAGQGLDGHSWDAACNSIQRAIAGPRCS